MCVTYFSNIFRQQQSKKLWFHRKHTHTSTDHLHRYTNTHSQIVSVTNSLVLLSQHDAQSKCTIWTVKINVFVFLDLPRFLCVLENQDVPVARQKLQRVQRRMCVRVYQGAQVIWVKWEHHVKQEGRDWDGQEMH